MRTLKRLPILLPTIAIGAILLCTIGSANSPIFAHPNERIYCLSESPDLPNLGIDALVGLVINESDARIRRVQSIYDPSLLKQIFAADSSVEPALELSEKYGPQNCREESQNLDCLIHLATDPASVDFGTPTGKLDTARLAQIERLIQPRPVNFQLSADFSKPQRIEIDGVLFTCSLAMPHFQ